MGAAASSEGRRSQPRDKAEFGIFIVKNPIFLAVSVVASSDRTTWEHIEDSPTERREEAAGFWVCFFFFFALSSFWFGWDPAVGKLHCYGVHRAFDVLEGRAARRAGVTPSTNRGWGGGE